MGSCVHIRLSFIAIALHFLVLVAETSSSRCDFFNGKWVLDEEESPLYNPSVCRFIEREFNCDKNGRDDQDFTKYKWQPHNCNLQRFDGKAFLEKFRGKSFMFVGDSLSRNQWQSLTCLLHSAVPSAEYTDTRVGDVSNFEFTEYGVKVMLDRKLYLVDNVKENIGKVLKLDSIEEGEEWKGIDYLIFNTWHWWYRRGPSQPLYVDGISLKLEAISSKIWIGCLLLRRHSKLGVDMDRMLAFEKALETWGHWVDTHVDPAKIRVFFQGISPSHYNGTLWGEPRARTCEGQKEPLLESTYPGEGLPQMPRALVVLKNALSKITNPVTLLDITNLSLLRKDGHPSIYGMGGRKGMDYTHWCLCGVPNTWNEILYNLLL